MPIQRTIRQLRAVDWDFPEPLPGTGSSIHWYPATFPASLPTTLIQAFSDPGDLVVDPFGGVGTTAIEAVRLGRRAITAENNVIGAMTSYAAIALTLANATDARYGESALDRIGEILDIVRDERQASLVLRVDHEFSQAAGFSYKALWPKVGVALEHWVYEPSWDLLAAWYEPTTLHSLRAMYQRLTQETAQDIFRLIGLVMLSAIARPASSQTQSWGHIADNVLPRALEKKDVRHLCLNWLRRVRGILRETYVDSRPRTGDYAAAILLHDWYSDVAPGLPLTKKADLLITSPPYASAIDYTLAQRLSMYLFGRRDEDLATQTQREIGARRKRFWSQAEEVWCQDLMYALSQQLGLLKKDAVACFVLPHKEAGREVGAEGLTWVLEEAGFEPVFSTDRSIRQSRTRQSWTSIKKETILVFARGNKLR